MNLEMNANMSKNAILIFTATALVGPLIRIFTWPPSYLNEKFPSISNFIYDFVFLLWPAQPLAIIESHAGHLVAALMAILGNIFLFVALAFLASVIASRWWLIAIYLLACSLIMLLAYWGAGYEFAGINFLTLTLAWIFYAIPFWIVSWIDRSKLEPGRLG